MLLETQPTSTHSTLFNPDHTSVNEDSIRDLLQTFQFNMERQLSNVNDKLETINSRIDALEAQQRVTASEGMASVPVQSTPLPSLTCSGNRRRVTPPTLQV